jgi:uncharacterized protein YbjT (DUF2867 family)
VKTRSQPIAVRDVLAYLVGCLDIPIEPGGATYDIGGPEILTYREMMLRFASILGLKRRIIDVPVLTPRLSAYWANLGSSVRPAQWWMNRTTASRVGWGTQAPFRVPQALF